MICSLIKRVVSYLAKWMAVRRFAWLPETLNEEHAVLPQSDLCRVQGDGCRRR